MKVQKRKVKKLEEDLKIYGLGYGFVHSWTDGASPLTPMMRLSILPVAARHFLVNWL